MICSFFWGLTNLPIKRYSHYSISTANKTSAYKKGRDNKWVRTKRRRGPRITTAIAFEKLRLQHFLATWADFNLGYPIRFVQGCVNLRRNPGEVSFVDRPSNSLVANPKAEWLMRRVKTPPICYIQFDSRILIRKEEEGKQMSGGVEEERGFIQSTLLTCYVIK